MYDSTQEDFEKKFPNNSANPAPYLQRSLSAPAIAEHVSDAILPAYNYDDVDMQSSMLYQYGNNNGPSRLNPRMPNAKKENNDELNSSYNDLLDDNTGLLSSLIDNKLRTPMDLIQADFPSTPSSVYGRMPDNSNGGVSADEDRSSDAPASSGGASTTTTASTNNDDSAALDQATKSFQQLYVNAPDHSPKASAGQAQTPLLSQYQMNGSNAGTNANNNMRPSSFFPTTGSAAGGSQQQQPLSLATTGGNGMILGGGNAEKGSRMFPNAHNNSSVYDHSNYNTLLGNSPSAILNNGLNPLAAAVSAPSLGAAGGLNAPPGQQQGNQPAYYVQQAVYLDQNGQPVYYRPQPGAGQYGQEFMYPPTGPDGQPVPMGMAGADQMQQQGFSPYTNVNGMNPTLAAQYWSQQQQQNPADPQAQLQQGGMPMYGQQLGGMPLGGDNGRRMVYNPATGQYNSIAAPMQQGGGGRGNGGQQMGAYGMQMHGQGGSNLLGRGGDDMFHDDRMGLGGRNMGGDMDYGRGRGGYGGGMGGMDRNGGRDRDGRDRNGRGGMGGGGGGGGGGGSAGGVNPVRDSLVEEFRSTYGKSRQWGLRDLLGHVVAFCQDQHGSRFIQQRLEVCSDVDKQLIFDEIIPAAQSLMTDVFGNYVLQKLFEYGTADQCESLALLLKGQSVQLAMQMYGCRVVQKALEYVSTQRLIDLVTEFESPPLLLRCVHDSNGNHVIQKCIEIVSKVAKEASTPEMSEYLSGRIQFIIAAFQGRVKELSSHPYGCRVVQRILEHCSNSQKAVILEELRQCCTDLVQDCYGNYVIQFVMQHGWEADRAVLIREVQSNLLDFSQHKFASNVVEKCLQYANKKDRDEMIWTIINVTFDLKNPVDAKGHCVLESMVRDPYANYVVQKVIDVSDERQRAAIMRYVKENITQLRRYTYGKHIIVRLEKITNEKF